MKYWRSPGWLSTSVAERMSVVMTLDAPSSNVRGLFATSLGGTLSSEIFEIKIFYQIKSQLFSE